MCEQRRRSSTKREPRRWTGWSAGAATSPRPERPSKTKQEHAGAIKRECDVGWLLTLRRGDPKPASRYLVHRFSRSPEMERNMNTRQEQDWVLHAIGSGGRQFGKG